MARRLSKGKKMMLLTLGIVVDIVEIFLTPTIFIAIVSGVVQYGVIWFLFKTSGVNFFGNSRQMQRRGGAIITESIPVVEMLPIFTWSIYERIKEADREDDEREARENQENSTIRTKNNPRSKNSRPPQAKNPNVIRTRRGS